MTDSLIRYDQMVDDALRSVVRTTLRQVRDTGLPGDHHLFISFVTDHPGVAVPPYLRERYPEEMTIVLQFQFWDLIIERDLFRVTLSFQDKPEKLVIPFAAVTSFADPAAKFGLQFKPGNDVLPEDDMAEDDEAAPLAFPEPAATADEPVQLPIGEKKPCEIVPLESFRRK
jgi:hypothetical protein